MEKVEMVLLYMFYGATVEEFSSNHLIFAVIAIAVLIALILLPLLLLLLHPLRCFHKCSLMHFRVHTRMELMALGTADGLLSFTQALASLVS